VVPRATLVCEDLRARLVSLGLPVRALGWGERVGVGDLDVHVLPFIGEQFLTSEEHPELRNWGNLYVVEGPHQRVLVAADGGFEPGRSVFDAVREHVARHGPVDVLAAQAIGLRTTFGGGDPDLQLTALTCPHRAPEAFELLTVERRVTMNAGDVAALAVLSGAKHVLLHGQFSFARGAPCVVPSLVSDVRRALCALGREDVLVPSLRNGEGIFGGDVPMLG
jgi:hypothetical protein